jgi:hypothetical protein
MFDVVFFGSFSLPCDRGCSAEVGIGRRHIVRVCVIALVARHQAALPALPSPALMFDERLELCFQIAWQEVVFQ